MSEPFDPNGRLVVVPVVVSGPRGPHEFRFGVDTAATRTSMAGLILGRLGYREPDEADRGPVRTGSGGTRAGLVRVARVAALGQSRPDFPILWMPHPPAAMIDGLLGLDFFRGLVLILDFARGQISLGPPRRWWQLWR
jgi:hypothetical protein